MQTVQAPQVAGVLAGPAQGLVETEIGPIDRLGLLILILLHQQRTEGMAGRLHPAPGLVIGQGVVQLDRFAQMVKGDLVVAAAVFQLAVQHLLGDRQQVKDDVVMHPPGVRHPRLGGEEGLLLALGLGDITQGGMGDGLGVEHHRGGRAIQRLIDRQRLVDDFLPFAEPHQHMLLHRQITFDEVGHRRRGHPQQCLRRGVDQLLRRFDRRGVLAKEHGAIDDEVMVVGAIHRVDVQRAVALQILAVGDDGFLIIDDDVAIITAEHVDMGRHMGKMTAIRHHVAQPITGPERQLGKRRHLHQMHIQMQQPRMIPTCRPVTERGLQHLARLGGPGALGDLAGGQIPHLPGRLVHDRLDEDRSGFQVVRMGFEDLAHGVGVVNVPGV